MTVAVYDNFDGSSLDGGRWNSTSGITVTGGSVTITGNNTNRSIDTSGKLAINVGIGQNSIIWSGTNFPTSPTSSHFLGMDKFYFYIDFNSTEIFVNNFNDVKVATGVIGGSSLREFRIDWMPDGSAKYYIDGSLVYTTTGTYLTAQYLKAQIFDTGKSLSSSAVIVSLLGVVTETTLLTETVISQKGFTRSISEGVSLSEAITSNAPHPTWNKQVKAADTWSNQTKS